MNEKNVTKSITITSDLLETVSVKGRGYLEAALKIIEGTRLIKEGEGEMAHLDGKSRSAGGRQIDKTSLVTRARSKGTKTIAARTALRPKTAERRSPRTEAEIRAAAALEMKKHPSMSLYRLIHVVGGSERRTRKIITAMMGKKRKPEPKRATSTQAQRDARPVNSVTEAADAAKILDLLKAAPGTTTMFMKMLHRSFYPVERVLRALTKAGKIVRKDNTWTRV